MNSHELTHTEIITFIDRHGKKRTRLVPHYKRSAETERAMEELRLGPYKDIQPLDNQGLFSSPEAPRQLQITADHATAKRIVATRLRLDRSPHLSLTGAEILSSYLDQANAASTDLIGGFPQFLQVYLLFGYVEARNRYLPELIAQLVGVRFHRGDHCWLLTPSPLETLAHQWGPSIASLSYLPTESLVATGPASGPVSVAQVRQTEPTPDFKDPQSDPKFRRRKKR